MERTTARVTGVTEPETGNNPEWMTNVFHILYCNQKKCSCEEAPGIWCVETETPTGEVFAVLASILGERFMNTFCEFINKCTMMPLLENITDAVFNADFLVPFEIFRNVMRAKVRGMIDDITDAGMVTTLSEYYDPLGKYETDYIVHLFCPKCNNSPQVFVATPDNFVCTRCCKSIDRDSDDVNHALQRSPASKPQSYVSDVMKFELLLLLNQLQTMKVPHDFIPKFTKVLKREKANAQLRKLIESRKHNDTTEEEEALRDAEEVTEYLKEKYEQEGINAFRI